MSLSGIGGPNFDPVQKSVLRPATTGQPAEEAALPRESADLGAVPEPPSTEVPEKTATPHLFGKPQRHMSSLMNQVTALLAAARSGVPLETLAENATIFDPRPPAQNKPAFVEERTLKTEDGVKLQAWYTPGPKEAPLVLHFHGTSHNLDDDVNRIQGLRDKGFRVMSIEWRGYGKSEGVPTLDGIKKDAAAAYKEALKETNPENLMVSGQSAGGAVAADLANENKVGGAILESTFTSLADVGQHLGGETLAKLAGDRLPVKETVASVQAPILVAHGDQDTIAPASMGDELAGVHGSEVFKASGAGHLNVDKSDGYFDAVAAFAGKCGMTPMPPSEGGWDQYADQGIIT